MDMLKLQRSLETMFHPDAMYPTGSRFYDTHSETSDYDFLLLDSSKDLLSKYTASDFVNCSTGNLNEELVVVRNSDNVNLIITNNPVIYAAWKKATLICKSIKANKQTAKRIHREAVDHLLEQPTYGDSTPNLFIPLGD